MLSKREIEKKIVDYKAKLSEVTFEMVAGKRRKRPIKDHLRKLYLKEITKLQNELQNLNLERVRSYQVDWNDVVFDDGSLGFRLNNRVLGPLRQQMSLKCFELIKPLFYRFNLEPVYLKVRGTEILEVENLDSLKDVVLFLDFHNRIKRNSFHSLIEFSQLYIELSKISNIRLFDFYRLSNKSEYFKELCILQSDRYKVLPLIEVKRSHNGQTTTSDTFIFSIVRDNKVYLVWESTEEQMATYLFQTNTEEYQKKLYELYLFISGGEERKRLSLRKKISERSVDMGVVATVIHSDIELWKSSLYQQLNK
jgi:hypothetical protein